MRAAVAAAIALVVRLAVVVAVGSHFPPAADGSYYHIIASRIAEGHGYTWLWPDGAVTFAAHYPVGYPALIAIGYAVFGPHPWLAMVLNAFLGALTSWAIYRLVLPFAKSERWAFAAALLVGLHPALVPYTAALMTEAVTAALLAFAAALVADGSPVSRRRLLAVGLVMGITTLVRPQSVVLAPVLGALALPAGASLVRRALGGAAVLAVALMVCAPWTVRNCVRMKRCALVSVNAGWNLLIGEETDSGAWQEVHVPDECTTVWDEAGKDLCFERAAKRRIAAAPGSWVWKAPAKLRTTFDYFGAAPWYLHLSNPNAFSERAKVALGTVETVAARLLLVVAHVMLGFRRGERRRARMVLGALGVVAALSTWGWVSYLLLAVLALVTPSLERGVLLIFSAAVILATAATHAAFFGAGRYGLVVVPFVTALACCSAASTGTRRISGNPPLA
jgi:hypothetical protein